MPLDIYTTRAQLAAIELFPREYSFLYDTFCKDEGAVEDEKAIYDFKKGSRLMAPVVHKGVGGVLMERDALKPANSASARSHRNASLPIPTCKTVRMAKTSLVL